MILARLVAVDDAANSLKKSFRHEAKRFEESANRNKYDKLYIYDSTNNMSARWHRKGSHWYITKRKSPPKSPFDVGAGQQNHRCNTPNGMDVSVSRHVAQEPSKWQQAELGVRYKRVKCIRQGWKCSIASKRGKWNWLGSFLKGTNNETTGQ